MVPSSRTHNLFDSQPQSLRGLLFCEVQCTEYPFLASLDNPVESQPYSAKKNNFVCGHLIEGSKINTYISTSPVNLPSILHALPYHF